MKNVRCVVIKESSTLKLQVSIEREIILPCLLLSSIVSVLKKELDAIAVEILEQLLPQIEFHWLETKEPGVDIRKFVSRTIKTCFGWVHFYYRQARKNGKHFRPLLEILGIGKGQRLTRDLMEIAFIASLYASYRKALKIAGHVCSLGTLWCAVQKEGEMYTNKREQAIYYYSEGAPREAFSDQDFAIVMIDEIWIRHVKKGKHIKVKVARLCVFRYRDGTYVGEPLRVFATARGDQKSFVKKAKHFFDATSGLDRIPMLIAITDGCEMGKKLCALYPEPVKTAWQLDWWHLWGYVHKGCKFEKDLERNIWDLLNVEKVDEALGILSAYKEAMKCMEGKIKEHGEKLAAESPGLIKPGIFWSSRQIELLDKLITYINKNRHGMYGVKAFVKDIPAEYLPFGSGPIERLQAVLIAYRMKKQGKHWSIEGADNLIQLLSREWNGEELEKLLDEGIEGLEEWEAICIKDIVIDREESRPSQSREKKKRTDFSPNPVECVPVLKRGTTGSCFTPLKGISNLKLIPHVVDFREGGCLKS